jgi:SsrA-binding protein
MIRSILYTTKKLGRDYQITDTLEAGIVLYGWEVKSIKDKTANFTNAFILYEPDSGRLLLKGLIVPAWHTAPRVSDIEQKRDSVFLTSKREAIKLGLLSKQPGFTLIPKSVYENDRGLIKIEIGVVRGKKKFEKKQMLKERDMQRQMEIDMKNHF